MNKLITVDSSKPQGYLDCRSVIRTKVGLPVGHPELRLGQAQGLRHGACLEDFAQSLDVI